MKTLSANARRCLEALHDRASFRGFLADESTPERTASVRFQAVLVARRLDAALVDEVTTQLRAKAVRVKTGMLVDATVVASASEDDGETA